MTQVMEKFSKEFEESYVETLSRLHGTKRVPANQIYQVRKPMSKHALSSPTHPPLPFPFPFPTPTRS